MFKLLKSYQVFSDHNDMKLEVSNGQKAENFTNVCKLNSTLLNNQWVRKKSEGKQKYLETNENGSTIYQLLGGAAKADLRGK